MQVWQLTRGGIVLTGSGNQNLLASPLIAFFSSRQCPGVAIRLAMDWARQQAQSKTVVISGFQSPLEQSVLQVLIQAGSPVVAVLARSIANTRLPTDWAKPLAQERLTVISATDSASRLTGEVAARRNKLTAQLANGIVVAHASPGGALASLLTEWRLQAQPVTVLA